MLKNLLTEKKSNNNIAKCVLYFCGQSSGPSAKKSSHYLKGLVIGAMSVLGLTIIVVLLFLLARLLTKKERAAKRYSDVKKQRVHEASEIKLKTALHTNFF